VQPIDKTKSNIRRPRSRVPRLGHKLAGLMLGLAVIVPMAAIQPSSADARASLSCSGWHSTTTPPNTIRVLRRRTGRVEVVNFQHYVVTVMGKEWPSYLPYQLLEAGAIAVKQYGWYKALDGHQRITRDGHCFDVYDGTADQLYKPNRARVRDKHWQAVRATWGVSLRKRGVFFMTGYRRGDQKRCGRDATGYKLFARSATHCADSGKDWRQILDIYYGPRLDIVGH
jgi:hypothetical protein